RRLEAAWLVVDAGVDDATVVPRLVDGDVILTIEHDDGRVGLCLEQVIGRRQPDDARPDDAVAVLIHCTALYKRGRRWRQCVTVFRARVRACRTRSCLVWYPALVRNYRATTLLSASPRDSRPMLAT